MTEEPSAERWVGPVLVRGRIAMAVASAIVASNPRASVREQGSYLRIRAPSPCVLRRGILEEQLGAPFPLEVNLGRIMPSFQGRLTLGIEEVRWE